MSIESVAELIHHGKRFLVTCHRRPDADALGSAIGLAFILQKAGKDVRVYVPETVMSTVRFLMESAKRDGLAFVATIDSADRFDATFVTDTAAKALLPAGLPGKSQRGPLVVVDHHASHDDVGDVVVRDVHAAATAEVVVALARALGMKKVPPEAAHGLYAAIVADTGGFRYSATTAATLRLGAELVEAGADPWSTAYELFEGWEPERMRLLGAVLDTLETGLNGRLAILRVTRKLLADTGADDDMVEGMVVYGRMLRGVEVAALLWEWPVDGGARLETKISLRSRGAIDVAAIAATFGGGGHRAAGGAQIALDIESVAGRVREETARRLS